LFYDWAFNLELKIIADEFWGGMQCFGINHLVSEDNKTRIAINNSMGVQERNHI